MVELIGQDRAMGVLHDALARGRFHHAWLFHGPRGVGKRTAAVEIARILLDPHARMGAHGRLAADPHGETSRLIDAGTHPDLHLIHKELALFSELRELRTRKLTNIPIDLLRERVFGGVVDDGRVLEGPAYRTAMQGHGKVFIIDEAELLDGNGQNAFLKTLEEPPAGTYFILVTSQPQALLSTIRSRCQQVAFRSLTDDEMQRWAQRAELKALGEGKEEGRAVGAQEREWILRNSDGSPGLALLAAQYGFHRWHTTIEPMLQAMERLGTGDGRGRGGGYPMALGEMLGGFAEEFAKAWVDHHKQASKDAANKDGTEHVLGVLARYARRMLRERAGNDAAADVWMRLIGQIRTAERQVDSNVGHKIAMENLVVQWAAGEPAVLALVE